MAFPRRKFAGNKQAIGKAKGFRSGLEESVANQLISLSVPVVYEQHKIEFTQPAKLRTYTPDFLLPNGIIVETKGYFEAEDRQKHLFIKQQNPEIDIRFVFTNPNTKLRKGSPTSYAMWCDKNGFLYAQKLIPIEWLNESPKKKRN